MCEGGRGLGPGSGPLRHSATPLPVAYSSFAFDLPLVNVCVLDLFLPVFLVPLLCPVTEHSDRPGFVLGVLCDGLTELTVLVT